MSVMGTRVRFQPSYFVSKWETVRHEFRKGTVDGYLIQHNRATAIVIDDASGRFYTVLLCDMYVIADAPEATGK